MSDDAKVAISAVFLVVCLIVAVSLGVYNQNENTYREKALAASTELAKARLVAEPARVLGERLDAILGCLERIEGAMAPRHATGAVPPKEFLDRFSGEKP